MLKRLLALKRTKFQKETQCCVNFTTGWRMLRNLRYKDRMLRNFTSAYGKWRNLYYRAKNMT